MIKGYQQTSKGIELVFKYIDKTKQTINLEAINQNINNTNTNTNTISNKNNLDYIKEKIEAYKNQNLTVRQIQNRLKKENISLTQKQINSY